MKKKKTLYIMLPIVVTVWGFVFYQLFASFFSTPNYATEKAEQIINIEEIKEDTFLIIADYRDPFLGKKVRLKKTNYTSSNVKKSSVKKSQVKTERSWPSITYNGMIKNNNSDRRVGIVKVNGKEYLVKEKDVVNEVAILSIGKNTVSVRFQKENKTITK